MVESVYFRAWSTSHAITIRSYGKNSEPAEMRVFGDRAEFRSGLIRKKMELVWYEQIARIGKVEGLFFSGFYVETRGGQK